MKILSQVKITAGRAHAWYETDLGFPIRKPLGAVKRAPIIDYVPLRPSKPWWKRLWEWIKRLW